MAYFVVTYDLKKKPEYNYDRLRDELISLSGQRYQESCWFCDCETTPSGLRDHLKQFIHADDWLMVVQFDQRLAWTIAYKGTAEWVKARFP